MSLVQQLQNIKQTLLSYLSFSILTLSLSFFLRSISYGLFLYLLNNHRTKPSLAKFQSSLKCQFPFFSFFGSFHAKLFKNIYIRIWPPNSPYKIFQIRSPSYIVINFVCPKKGGGGCGPSKIQDGTKLFEVLSKKCSLVLPLPHLTKKTSYFVDLELTMEGDIYTMWKQKIILRDRV